MAHHGWRWDKNGQFELTAVVEKAERIVIGGKTSTCTPGASPMGRNSRPALNLIVVFFEWLRGSALSVGLRGVAGVLADGACLGAFDWLPMTEQVKGAPILLRRMGQDPATASFVILATVTDAVGFFSLLGGAALFAPLLVVSLLK